MFAWTETVKWFHMLLISPQRTVITINCHYTIYIIWNGEVGSRIVMVIFD